MDTGPGISAGHLPHIFNRFYRADDTHTVEGTGIGLALAWELTQLHHGTLSVESVVGQGSTFTLTLPVNRVSFAAEEIDETPPEHETLEPRVAAGPIAETTSTPIETPVDGKPIVLVIEDNADLRAYIREYLESEYTVREAPDGKAGCDLAFEMIPDIVVSDVMMPVMDGVETIKNMILDGYIKDNTIVVLTAKKIQGEEFNEIYPYIYDYIMKPFDVNDLLSTVRNILRKAQKKRKIF
jgi:CheY-like chemotaxis protein